VTLSISNSEIRTYQTCRRKWMLAYYHGWRLKQSEEDPTGAVTIGSQIHLAMEAWYGHSIDPLAVLNWSYRDVIAMRPEFEKPLMKDLDMALAMVEGYLQWAAETGVDAGLEVVAAEHVVAYEIPLTDPGLSVVLRAKLDLLFRRRSDGRLLLRDWKTVGTFRKADALLLDQQMRFYVMLQALSHRDPRDRIDGVLYLMMRRSKRTVRATGPFYAQEEVSYNRHDLNSTYQRARQVVSEIVLAHTQLDAGVDHHAIAYPNPGDYCSWGCAFRSICPMFDDGSRVEEAITARFEKGDPYRYYSAERIERVLGVFT
jgi:hypothetical protein